jgi:hypothetical protein
VDKVSDTRNPSFIPLPPCLFGDLISKGMIDNVRRNSDVVTAYVNNKALIVDKGSDAEIIYAGRNLELANLESEAHDLYHLITYIS